MDYTWSTISNLFTSTQELNMNEVILRMVMAAFLGLIVYFSYWVTHAGTIYSKKFNVSLVTLTVLAATAVAIAGNNVALSLSLGGILSIVRFRTAIKDSRDMVYIFWSVITGLGCGVGDYAVTGFGCVAAFILLFLLGRIKNDNRILLVIRSARSQEVKIEKSVYEYFDGSIYIRVKNTTPDSLELIYEISNRVYNKCLKKEQSITELLYELEGMEYVNIVNQTDDIGS